MAGILARFFSIEHFWDMLDRRVRRRDPQKADLLEEFLRQE